MVELANGAGARGWLLPGALRGRLFRKYALLFAGIVSGALIANGLLDIWFSYREQRALLVRIQREQASAAAAGISQFVKEIEGQIGWTTQLPWMADSIGQRRFEALRLLRQVPAITELTLLDASGLEQVKVSRLTMDVVGSRTDRSKDTAFVGAMARKVFYGPVYFRHESEPYMRIAMSGARREGGVGIAEVNLTFIWEVVSQIKVGERGQAYVIDDQGYLIAHPDINLVLSNTDLSHLPQTKAARSMSSGSPSWPEPVEGLLGQRVLVASAPVPALGWLVFVELPVAEAFAPIYASIARSGILLIGALGLAIVAGLVFARKMVVPIQALQASAQSIGSGNLAQRISINTDDELEALGDQFNAMATQLEASYATLERKVEERTQQLEQANLAKSRFLAIASHDLRQPLHALGMFVAQLRSRLEAPDRESIVNRVDQAVAAMNELFDALLDVSKLDAGALTVNRVDFPISRVLERLERTFAPVAHQKDLSFRVVPSRAWVRSDPILLERILLNIVSNAVRHTKIGSVLVGCRRRHDALRIEVWDSGPGIPPDQRESIFKEFVRLASSEPDGQRGLGLGLAIVERLCGLLSHPITLDSKQGKGSRFAVSVPQTAALPSDVEATAEQHVSIDTFHGQVVVIVDDDALALDGMAGLLRSWGCRVVTFASASRALANLDQRDCPELIIADYSLPDGETGIDLIRTLRGLWKTEIPAFVISADTVGTAKQQADASGYRLLKKPVSPMKLRAMVAGFLKRNDNAVDAVPEAQL